MPYFTYSQLTGELAGYNCDSFLFGQTDWWIQKRSGTKDQKIDVKKTISKGSSYATRWQVSGVHTL